MRRRPAGRWLAALCGGGFPMLTTTVLNSILGLDIILVLVLVAWCRKRIVRLVMRETRAG